MPDMWIEKPKLRRVWKVRIFKDPTGHPSPWVLILPGKLHRVRYPDWHTPWLVAGTIQDKRNRNEPFI